MRIKLIKTGVLSLAILAGLSLSACGFTPMYAKPTLGRSLSQIDIQTPQTRTGFFLGQNLRQTLGEDASTPKAYALKVEMSEQHYNIGYRVDETSTRSEITNNVVYKLIDLKTQAVLHQDHFTETVTYASSTSPFTGIVAQQDGQVRMARLVADRIQGELAIYFHEN
ncbi:MAG: hypothetical protein ACXU8U_08190 [Asticcacaulis sp.]